MSTATIAGTTVELNDEGFFVHPTQWTRDIAAESPGSSTSSCTGGSAAPTGKRYPVRQRGDAAGAEEGTPRNP